jgi:hypothetical protein
MNDPARIAYLGGEAEAAGFALAGLDARAPPPGEESAAFADVRATAHVVLLGAALAARLPRAMLEAALAARAPLAMIVPEAAPLAGLPDPVERARHLLGMDA